MDKLSFFWIFLIIITCGFGAILYLLVTHDSGHSDKDEKEDKKDDVQPVKANPLKGLTERQKSILQYMMEKRVAKPLELNKVAGNVSSRTVRRDMDVLVEKGLVSQEGSTKSTYYKYIGE